MKLTQYLFVMVISLSCNDWHNTVPRDNDDTTAFNTGNTLPSVNARSKSNGAREEIENAGLTIKTVSRPELVNFAKTLTGVHYKYASIDPSEGFDCSGFITYVFNHFGIAVPRSSVDFTNVGIEMKQQDAKEGDLILFTGTVDSIKTVGHMGIVTENSDTLKFIHATSGRAYGVTISKLGDHYHKRFVKIISVFPNDAIGREVKF